MIRNLFIGIFMAVAAAGSWAQEAKEMVYPQADKPSNLVLMEAVKDARPMLHPMPPLIIYEKDHTLTKELQSVYHIEQNMV